MNDFVGLVSDLDAIIDYDADRYQGWSLDRIIAALRGGTLNLLKRGTLSALIARREWGGLLIEASRLLSTKEQIGLFRRVVNLDYAEARRHMKLWVFWDRIVKMLSDHEASCQRRGLPFVVPGYRRCLAMAGITGKSRTGPYQPPPPLPERDPLPEEVQALMQMVEELEQKNRLEREANARLTVELDLAHDEIRELTFDRRRHPVVDDQTSGIIGSFTGWLRRKRPKPMQSDRIATIEVRTGDCLTQIEQDPNVYDAIVTDPPYAIALHGYEWDSTEISFSPTLWQRFMKVLKPGGYVAFFTAPRLYHRAAKAAEDAGFSILPFLAWRFREGLPKPINLSELFDRDNLDEREIIGERRGSGFTQANVDHGLQQRSHTMFAARARHVSQEAQDWRGYFYGRNALKPCLEPIMLVQKPIATERMIDNVRQWGTGALNIGALRDQYGFWPSSLFTHRKTNKHEHKTTHPSVKPITLMEDLCTLVCPGGGRILDAFAGTGTTGIAAKRRGFDCVLIEQNPVMCDVIRDRLDRMS
jgi:site-specific DNA-methyltransferase (adenine-specific)